MVILSGDFNLEGKPRPDQEFIDWVKKKPYPGIEVWDGPAGIYLTAWTTKDPIVKWLDPAPAPYR